MQLAVSCIHQSSLDARTGANIGTQGVHTAREALVSNQIRTRFSTTGTVQTVGLSGCSSFCTRQVYPGASSRVLCNNPPRNVQERAVAFFCVDGTAVLCVTTVYT